MTDPASHSNNMEDAWRLQEKLADRPAKPPPMTTILGSICLESRSVLGVKSCPMQMEDLMLLFKRTLRNPCLCS